MKNILIAAVAAVTLSAGAGSAAVLDFLADANNSERGVASGTTLDMVTANTYYGGVQVTVSSNFNPYFDSGNAGLGVCQILVGTQCSPPSDDNVTSNESLTVGLDGTYKLSNLVFTGEGHSSAAGIQPLATNNETLLFAINGEALQEYTFAALSAATFENVMSFSLHFDDANFQGGNNTAEQFYLASAVVNAVPVPAALPMLLAGLGGLGFMARRKRKAA